MKDDIVRKIKLQKNLDLSFYFFMFSFAVKLKCREDIQAESQAFRVMLLTTSPFQVVFC